MAKPVPTSRLVRGSKLGALAAGSMLRNQRARMSMIGRSDEVRRQMAQEAVLRSTEQIVTVMGTMKGIAMKLGQMFSVLDMDLVPEHSRDRFQRRLAVLRDSAPTVSTATMCEVIEADLGKPVSELFAEFEPEPLAAASIGQVYRARLCDGRQVAVKVQYPNIDRAVQADLRNLGLFRRILQQAFPWATPAVLEELRINLENELDYRHEADNQLAAAAAYADHPFIAVPQPITQLCTRRVLVTEFLAGQKFTEIRELPAEQRDRVGEIVYRFYLGSMFTFSEFCGDPHPGNVLLTTDGRVGFLDFGLYNRMGPADLQFEVDCLRASCERDGARLQELFLSRGIVQDPDQFDADACLEYMLAAMEWCLTDTELTVTPEMASSSFLLAVDPRAAEPEGMTLQVLPAEHLFSRRADYLTFGILGQLQATGNWHRILREWIYDDPPTTELGIAHQRWLRTTGRSKKPAGHLSQSRRVRARV